MKILANNLKRQYELFASEFEQKALDVLRSGWYILGEEVSAFEREFAEYVWSQYLIRPAYRSELTICPAKGEIGSIIHYPISPFLSQAYQYPGVLRGSFTYTEPAVDEVRSLLMCNGKTEAEQNQAITTLNVFSRKADREG